MPATITHAYFGNDLYNKLPNDIKNKLKDKKECLMMFSQSMDALMFYNIYTPFKGKDIRNLSSIFHNSKTNNFFSNLIHYMKKNKYYNDSHTLAFLYGLIAHFCLDSTLHPYIFYKTGAFNKKDKNTYKYNGYHTYMETYIDNYYIKTRNNKNINIKNIFDLTPFTKELTNSIDYSFEKTYKIKNTSKIYYTSLKQMKTFLILFRQDKFGIKKIFYKFIDLITPKNSFSFKSLSYKLDDYEKYDFLNKNNKIWYYPVDKNISSTKNFEQLYNEALEDALYIIKEINQYFYNDKKININNLFHNKSYVTGIDCNIKKKQTFFEF